MDAKPGNGHHNENLYNTLRTINLLLVFTISAEFHTEEWAMGYNVCEMNVVL